MNAPPLYAERGHIKMIVPSRAISRDLQVLRVQVSYTSTSEPL